VGRAFCAERDGARGIDDNPRCCGFLDGQFGQRLLQVGCMEPLKTKFDSTTCAQPGQFSAKSHAPPECSQMKSAAPTATAISGESVRTLEAHDLLSIREVLAERIAQRRLCLRTALQVLGSTLADALAEASCSTVQLFFDENEHGLGSLQTLRTLSRELQVSFFAVRTGVTTDISHGLRLHLRLQARRLDALVRTLASIESQVESLTYREALVAHR
jgi:hypothetical protein